MTIARAGSTCRRTTLAAVLVAVAGSTCAAQTEREWTARRKLMVERDVAAAGVKNRAVLAALGEVPRHEFVPPAVRPNAYLDMALPIGEQVTISPPFIVAWMTQQLDPRPTDRVLEIGTGSGYQAAVLSRLVKQVYTIEISGTLAGRARHTLARLGYPNVEVKHGDGYQGWAEHAPFDKILVTCSPHDVPRPLVDQLREGGRMVIPLGERYQQTLVTLEKRGNKLVTLAREPTFFVPMTGEAESRRRSGAEPALTPLVNGDFERLLEPGQPAGWYYLRQAQLAAGGPSRGSSHCLAFENRVAGQSCQALQAVGVDGRRVGELDLELWVKAQSVVSTEVSDDGAGARLLVIFFDEDRAPAGQQMAVGPWQGTFDWRSQRGRVAVPRAARVCIVAVGLLGATGRLWVDDVALRAADAGGNRP